MSVGQDVIAYISALPEAIMIVDLKGKLVGANPAFYEFTGIVEGIFTGKRLIKLPFSNKLVERGLIRLFLKATQGEDGESYSFQYARPDGALAHVSASARKVRLENGGYVAVTFKKNDPDESRWGNADSWKYFMAISQPCLEFHLQKPVPFDAHDDRLEFLRTLGDALRVKFANHSAAEFYGLEADGQKSSANESGRTFISLFNKEADAIGFLDMLSAVGNMKTETSVNTGGASVAHVEMDCMVKFDDDGSISALYSSQRDLADTDRYKAIIGGSRQETDFMFNQPFIGFALLVPPRPLERPSVENLDARLDEILNQITVVRANQAMLDIHGLDKTKLLMKPIRGFFRDSGTARQALKELFIMRETSVGWHKTGGDNAEPVSVFKAIFDTSDRLSGVLVATSRHSYGYAPRHA